MKYYLLSTVTIFENGYDKPLYANQVWKGLLTSFVVEYGEPAERDRHDVILNAFEISESEYLELKDLL